VKTCVPRKMTRPRMRMSMPGIRKGSSNHSG
jgi:hypothetical protein